MMRRRVGVGRICEGRLRNQRAPDTDDGQRMRGSWRSAGGPVGMRMRRRATVGGANAAGRLFVVLLMMAAASVQHLAHPASASGRLPSKSGHGARILMDTQLYPAFLKGAWGSPSQIRKPHGQQQQADGMFRRGRMVRALIGSSPPTCASKCNKCTPCKPVRVPIHPGQKKIGLLEYYPEAWRCKCKNKLYMP